MFITVITNQSRLPELNNCCLKLYCAFDLGFSTFVRPFSVRQNGITVKLLMNWYDDYLNIQPHRRNINSKRRPGYQTNYSGKNVNRVRKINEVYMVLSLAGKVYSRVHRARRAIEFDRLKSNLVRSCLMKAKFRLA